MCLQEYETPLEEITMRALRYRVEVAGYRVRAITLVTTLRDVAICPAKALAELDFR